MVSKLRCLRLRGGGGVHVLSEERLMGLFGSEAFFKFFMEFPYSSNSYRAGYLGCTFYIKNLLYHCLCSDHKVRCERVMI